MNIADVEHYFVLNILIEYTNFIDMFIVGIRDLSSIATQPVNQRPRGCCGNSKSVHQRLTLVTKNHHCDTTTFAAARLLHSCPIPFISGEEMAGWVLFESSGRRRCCR